MTWRGAVCDGVRVLSHALEDLLGRGPPAPADVLRQGGFAPDRPGAWCSRCGAGRLGNRCRAGACAPGRRVVRLGSHRAALREAVVAAKHRPWPEMAEHLGLLLGQQVAASCPWLADASVVVVPVPMPAVRRIERGVDHAALIAAAVARELRVRSVQPLAQRVAGSQVDARTRAQRLGRTTRFVARSTWRAPLARRAVKGRVVVLVDDVRTTGATLAATRALLLALGARAVLEAVASVRDVDELSETAPPVSQEPV